MAQFGFDVKPISRLRGESVAKTASYILRENVFDSYLNTTHYYSHVTDLLHSEVLVPENAPREFLNLQKLLDAIDHAEIRYDARTGRVIRLTLPNDKELSNEERIELTRRFVNDAFVSEGMCAVMAIHEGKNKNPEHNNPHAHVLLTDRPVNAGGFCAKKNRDWNKTKLLRQWRKLWAEMQNEFFKSKNLEMHVSHESLEVQGIDREPTKPLGRAAKALEDHGIRTEYGDKNRAIEAGLEEKRTKKPEHNRGWER